jgi:2-hydroxy-3-keto-5-methylthiopentenyl-1-phosphate phosphatase
MNDMRKALLDEFGEKLVSEVRDNACDFVQNIISGKMRDKTSAKQFKEYRSMDEQSAKVLQHFLLIAVDACLVQFLYFIDSNEIDVIVTSDNDLRVEIRSLSDGLVGEVHNEDGWFARFSRFKDRIEPLK